MARSERHLIAHLLRRAGFGSSAADLDFYTSLGFVGSVDRLINYDRVDDSALEETISQMRANNPTYSNADRPENGNPGLEVAIWLTRMLLTKRPLQEKMTLYWQAIRNWLGVDPANVLEGSWGDVKFTLPKTG